MKNFDLQLAGSSYEIVPQEDGTFIVMENGIRIGMVSPEPGDLTIEWKSNELKQDLVDQLGELISEHEMGRMVL